MRDILIYLYPITQFIIFLFYVPYVRSVLESETADAINVPAQLSFFITGFTAALYMFVVNSDALAAGIIVVHILIGNLAVALIAWKKQRKYKKRQQNT